MTGAFVQRVRILRFADFDFHLRSLFKMEQTINRKRFLSNDASEVDNKKPLLEADKVKRKKSAVLLAYSGVGYLGMQRNPGMKTIEEDLLQALLKSGYINDDAFATPQNIQFQRAARTDKGVSAARQVISAKLPEEININSINENLPEQIKVLSVKRTTKGFNSKSACNARTYSYTLPTFAFSPHGEFMENSYRITPEVIDKVNSTLQLFEGTHNFHNFTSRKRPLDPSAHRYIMKFECSLPFVCENLELATIKVKGQSFMLHQIRKMIGLTIAVVRGHTTADTIEKAWKHDRLDIPVAPGLGLVLDEVHYDRYNMRYGKDGIHEPLDWTEVEEEVQRFREKYILPTIVETELKEQSMYNWLITLPLHTYDIREDESVQEAEKASDANAESNDTSDSVEGADKSSDANAESNDASDSVQEVEKASDENAESNDTSGSTCRTTADSEICLGTVNGSVRASQ